MRRHRYEIVAVLLLAAGILAILAVGKASADTIRRKVVVPGKLKVRVPATADVTWRVGGDATGVQVTRRSRRWVKVRAYGGPRRLNLRLSITSPVAPVSGEGGGGAVTPPPTCLTQEAAQLETRRYMRDNYAANDVLVNALTGVKTITKGGYGYYGGLGSSTCDDAPYTVACDRQSATELTCIGQFVIHAGPGLNTEETKDDDLLPCTVNVGITRQPDGTLTTEDRNGLVCYPQWTVHPDGTVGGL